MTDTCSTTTENRIRFCPVAEMLEKHNKSFFPASIDLIKLAEDLDDALYGLGKDLTPADLRAAALEPLKDAEANLQDLIDLAEEALLTVQRIIELRMSPDAKWPA